MLQSWADHTDCLLGGILNLTCFIYMPLVKACDMPVQLGNLKLNIYLHERLLAGLNQSRPWYDQYHSEEAKLSHALRNINGRHFLLITKGFSNKRQWDFTTSQQMLFRTSLSTMILYACNIHTANLWKSHIIKMSWSMKHLAWLSFASSLWYSDTESYSGVKLQPWTFQFMGFNKLWLLIWTVLQINRSLHQWVPCICIHICTDLENNLHKLHVHALRAIHVLSSELLVKHYDYYTICVKMLSTVS